MKLRNPLYATLLAGAAMLPMAVGCKSNNDTINQPTPQNPVVPTPLPLTLQGKVVDSADKKPVAGATVTVLRPDNSTFTTLTTDGAGAYSVDVSALTVDSLTVRATAAGYLLGDATASLSRTSGTASVAAIPLYKMTGASQSFGPTGGSVTTAPTSESKSTTPLGLVVPAGAVASATTLTVGPLPVSKVPAPPGASAQTLAVVSISPVGLTFAQPVEVVCPLPLKCAAGRQLTAYRLNPNTNGWEPISGKAMVDATGLAVKLPLTATGTYTFTEDIVLDPNAAPSAAPSETEEATGTVSTVETAVMSKALKSGKDVISLPYDTTYTLTAKTGEVPTNSWLQGILNQRTGISFSYTVDYQLVVPALPAAYQKNGRQINPDKPSETGYWEYRWFFESYSPASRTLSFSYPGVFTVKIKVDQTQWRLQTANTHWYWVVTSGSSGL